jgi:hypothetical protein
MHRQLQELQGLKDGLGKDLVKVERVVRTMHVVLVGVYEQPITHMLRTSQPVLLCSWGKWRQCTCKLSTASLAMC